MAGKTAKTAKIEPLFGRFRTESHREHHLLAEHEGSAMYTLEDLKTNRDAQITVASITFFLLAFPLYFGFAAGNADGSLGGGVADYQVNGEITYVELASGSQYIDDGGSWSETFNTDAVNNADDLNIVGIELRLSYGEDEQPRGFPCASQTAPDTITGTVSHLEFVQSGDGTNAGGQGSHAVAETWYNTSMVGTVVSGLSMSEIEAQLDAAGAGLGAHMAEIGVAADGDSCVTPAGGDNQDGGEEVSWELHLMVLDYTIAPYIDTSEV